MIDFHKFLCNSLYCVTIYSQACRKRPLKGPKKCGLLTQVNYSAKWTFGGLKGQSPNTGGLKDRFNCTSSKLYEQ